MRKLLTLLAIGALAGSAACKPSEEVAATSDNGGGTAGDKAFTGSKPGLGSGSGMTGGGTLPGHDANPPKADAAAPQGKRGKPVERSAKKGTAKGAGRPWSGCARRRNVPWCRRRPRQP